MNIDRILHAFGDCDVDYLLIGGMNFLLRHEPVLTYDIDFWIHDTAANLAHCDLALRSLDAAWGATEQEWRPIAAQPGWLARQNVFCLTSPSGAIDIFRAVTGLASWEECKARSHEGLTAGGVPYRGLCDEDMIASQLALPPEQRADMTVPANDPTAAIPQDVVLREHEKRERAWTPAARWQAIQETIRWAEAQATVKRNSPAACIARERARSPVGS